MAAATDQLTLDLGVRPALGRSDFLVAPCNQEAVAWLDRWPDWPSPLLAIYGPAGAGKSHLAEVWRTQSGAERIDGRSLGSVDVQDRWRDAPRLVVEQLGGSIDERALLHLCNMVAERKGHLLLTAETPPARWPLALPDLVSRLRIAPVVALDMPDDHLLRRLLLKLFADRQITVQPEVPAYLVPRMERTFAAAARVVAALDHAALAENKPVTVSLARTMLDALGASADPVARQRGD